MRVNSMFHKNTFLLVLLALIFMNIVYEGYSQTPTKQNASLEEEQKGRSLILLGSTLYGLSLYGQGTSILLDRESVNQKVGLGLLFGGGSFAGALYFTRNHRLGAGRSHLILSGGMAGTLYGAGFPVFFGAEDEKAYITSMMITTPIGGWLAHKWSSKKGFEKGESHLMVNGSLVGGLYGVAIPYLINIEDLEALKQSQIYVGAAMVGAPIGLLTMKYTISNRSIHEGRSSLISFGGVLSSAYANGFLFLVGEDSPRAYVLATAVALPVGAILGYQLTAGDEYTHNRADLIQIGAFVGALFGNGFVLLGSAEDDINYDYVILASMVGSFAGTLFANTFTRGWGEKNSSERSNFIPSSEKITVSLPSISEWLTYGLITLRKPTFMGDSPVELVRISF